MPRARHQIVVIVIAATALAALAACGSTVTTSDGTVAPSDPPTTTVAATDAPSTTVAPSTTLAPTTTVAVTTGWNAFVPADAALPLAVPCCASNWYDLATSPALPAPGAPLADGVYRVDWEWPVAPATAVTATVRRFAPCSDLPENACEQPPEGMSFDPTDVGVDPTAEYTLTLSLGDSLQVVLGGFEGWDSDGNYATGNGADLLDLVTAVDADFDVAIMQPHLAGSTDDEIVAALTGTPANGFGPAPDDVLVLGYTHDDAPTLLFQTLLYNWEQPDLSRGSDVLGPIALRVEDGTYTVSVYAGYYS